MAQELDAFAEMMLDEAAVLAHASIQPNELRRLWAEGLTDVKKLADHFGVTEGAIEWRAVRLGLKKPQPGVDWAAARQLWSEGKNVREIASELNTSPGYVATILGKPEEDIGPRMRRMQVMTLAQKGLTQAEIAEKVGLSEVRVNHILTEAGSHGMAAIAARRRQVVEMHNAGMTPDEIAEGTGYNHEYVSAILKDYGLLPHRLPGTRPSEAEALRRRQQVWDLDDEGISPKDIAERVGLSLRSIYHIIRAKPDPDVRGGQKIMRELAQKTGVSVEDVGNYLCMNEHERRRLRETGITERHPAWTEEHWQSVDKEIGSMRQREEARLRTTLEEDRRELEALEQSLGGSSGSQSVVEPTAWELAQARRFWERTREQAAEKEPFAVLLSGAMERQYPRDTERQVRLTGYITELLARHPAGRFPAGEAKELAEKWGVPEITKFEDILPPAFSQATRESNPRYKTITVDKTTFKVDRGIVDLVTKLNKAGYKTADSCSGMREDHPRGPRVLQGYLSFKKKDLTAAQQGKIKTAARAAGLEIGETPPDWKKYVGGTYWGEAYLAIYTPMYTPEKESWNAGQFLHKFEQALFK